MERSSSLPVDHIWCAIPVYNNKETLASVAVECRSLIPQVVVVDDGSTDADVEELLSGSDITVLRHERNSGKGAAIHTALRYVRYQGARKTYRDDDVARSRSRCHCAPRRFWPDARLDQGHLVRSGAPLPARVFRPAHAARL